LVYCSVSGFGQDGRALPALGQHTAEVLADVAGYPPDAIRELAARGDTQM
jgi:crotonobetainyl-CoA:carnitine CoA-transferase CaiB-like acyl-CoA transferase